jgi:hypothetical protein
MMSYEEYINAKCQNNHSFFPDTTCEQESRNIVNCEESDTRAIVSVLKRTRSIEDIELYRSEEVLYQFHDDHKSKKSKTDDMETTTMFYNVHTNVLTFQTIRTRIQGNHTKYDSMDTLPIPAYFDSPLIADTYSKLDVEHEPDHVRPIQLNSSQIEVWLGMTSETSSAIESYVTPSPSLNGESSQYDYDESYFEDSDEDIVASNPESTTKFHWSGATSF